MTRRSTASTGRWNTSPSSGEAATPPRAKMTRSLPLTLGSRCPSTKSSSPEHEPRRDQGEDEGQGEQAGHSDQALVARPARPGGPRSTGRGRRFPHIISPPVAVLLQFGAASAPGPACTHGCCRPRAPRGRDSAPRPGRAPCLHHQCAQDHGERHRPRPPWPVPPKAPTPDAGSAPGVPGHRGTGEHKGREHRRGHGTAAPSPRRPEERHGHEGPQARHQHQHDPRPGHRARRQQAAAGARSSPVPVCGEGRAPARAARPGAPRPAPGRSGRARHTTW